MIENYVHWNEDIGEWQLVSLLRCLKLSVQTDRFNMDGIFF